MTTFGDEVRALRTARGWSLAELAAPIPCDKGHLSRIETGGRRDPGPALGGKVARGGRPTPCSGQRCGSALGGPFPMSHLRICHFGVTLADGPGTLFYGQVPSHKAGPRRRGDTTFSSMTGSDRPGEAPSSWKLSPSRDKSARFR